jgi:glycosyltransferase involved in cell wall biosynthesis
MKLQVLVSTMHQSDRSLPEKMNIQSDAIIINQCDRNEFDEFMYKDNLIRFLSLKERGVGLSRNTALMRANADICLFADDDVTYKDNYEDIIIKEFDETPEADVIIFNVPSTNPNRGKKIIGRKKRLHFYNSLGFGTYKIAVKLESVRKVNLCFSLLFGGGAKYSAGEDTIFLSDCFKKGLKIYGSPKVIGTVTYEESTWFKGYTDKYFYDRGILLYCISKLGAFMLCLQFAIRKRKLFEKEKTWTEAYKLMITGIRDFRR